MKNLKLIRSRKEKKLTQQELADLLGYKGRQAVANWENGYSEPPLTIAMKISILLEKDVDFLFSIQVQESHTNSNSA
jgi:putative transcriptional regulator